MGLAAAAAGKRAAAPKTSYVEDASDDDGEDGEYSEPARKKAKTPTTTGAQPKSMSVIAKTATAEAKATGEGAKAKAAGAKAASAALKGVIAKLGVLDRQQLAGVLQALLENGTVPPEKVETLLPSPDMSAYVKEGERLSAAIRRALPNSRYGSCTDHYGYKRCASANNACKKYIVDNAKVFKSAKQWQAALEYAMAMLPVAQGMVDFDLPEDCKARNAAIDQLTSLMTEAESRLGIAVPAPKATAGPSSAAGPSPAPALIVAEPAD